MKVGYVWDYHLIVGYSLFKLDLGAIPNSPSNMWDRAVVAY